MREITKNMEQRSSRILSVHDFNGAGVFCSRCGQSELKVLADELRCSDTKIEPIAEPGTMKRLEQIKKAIGRGWNHYENKNKSIDYDVNDAIYDEIVSLLESEKKPDEHNKPVVCDSCGEIIEYINTAIYCPHCKGLMHGDCILMNKHYCDQDKYGAAVGCESCLGKLEKQEQTEKDNNQCK